MRAHWLQHVAYEGLGHLEGWLARAGAEVTCTRLFAGEPLPDPDGIDLLVILGGPMSVNDDATLPWLVAEKAFIARVIDRGVGSARHLPRGAADRRRAGRHRGPQPRARGGLVAGRGGARAGRSPPARPCSPSRPRLTCLHWHGETFATALRGGPPGPQPGVCEHQAMQVGRRVIGLQFHPEATPDWVRAVLAHSPGSLRPGPYVMAENALTADLTERCRIGNSLAERLMEFIST